MSDRLSLHSTPVSQNPTDLFVGVRQKALPLLNVLMRINRASLLSVLALGLLGLPRPALGQSLIVPDDTLGAERSQVTTSGSTERITGGARRSQNLFHSFEEFNISPGRSALFASPQGLEHIFSRVTGGNPSRLFGTLGVEGAADLYFLNPNGIVFGEGASLDIDGSFFGSTADSLTFGDGAVFSATAPQDNLLTVSVPLGLQTGPTAGTLTNRATLAAGQDLTLTAGQLDLQGRITAGEALTLRGDILRIRDTATAPFAAVSGGPLLLQGDRVDISALAHPNSGLTAGGDLTLRSPAAVTGDARYWSGGNLRIETLSGAPGQLNSPNDPVLRAAGDVTLGGYNGASLHIIAGGSVTIPGAIAITGADPANGLVETVVLSNGEQVMVNGQTRPTLDIRAGTLAVGVPGTQGDPGGFVGGLPAAAAATGANITLGPVTLANGGMALLTNQFAPNAALPGGAIELGRITARATQGDAVVVDSRDSIRATGPINSAALGGGPGGDITLLGQGDVTLQGARMFTLANGMGDGGDIEIRGAAVTLNNSPLFTDVDGVGNAGNIQINGSESIRLSNSDLSSRMAAGVGNAGRIALTTDDLQVVNDSDIIVTSNGNGNAGTIQFTAATVTVRDFSDLRGFVQTPGGSPPVTGNGGSILIDATESVQFGNDSDININITTDVRGDGGVIRIRTGTLELLDDSEFFADTNGIGNAANILLQATESTRFDNSDISSRVRDRATGRGGNIRITTGALQLLNDSDIFATTDGNGGSGDIIINARTFEARGRSNLEAQTQGVGNGGRIILNAAESATFAADSDIVSIVGRPATGNGGDIRITTRQLSFTEDSEIFADTNGEGNGGAIVINAAEFLRMNAGEIASRVNPGAVGDGGDITIIAGDVELVNNSDIVANLEGNDNTSFRNAGRITIRATTFEARDRSDLRAIANGLGNGGDITINAAESVLFSRDSDIFTSLLQNSTGTSGDVRIITGNLTFIDDADLFASTGGTGNAGDVIIRARESFRMDRESNLFSLAERTANGNGGTISISVPVLEVINGSAIFVNTNGEGNAGSIIINAPQSVTFASDSAARANTDRTSVGNGGSIRIDTGTLEFFGDSELFASTGGQGDAGNIIINATERVTFNGGENDGPFPIVPTTLPVEPDRFTESAAITQVEAGATGDAGDIRIAAPIIEVLDGAVLSSSTFGEGDAGNVVLNASDRVVVSGANSNGMLRSSAASFVAEGAMGDGGNLVIEAPIVQVLGGALLSVDTAGLGSAGRVEITADERIVVRGESAVAEAVSTVSSLVEATGVGDGGDIRFEAPVIDVLNGAQLIANSAGDGEAGDIDLTGGDRVLFSGTSAANSGSRASSQLEAGAVGRGGNIRVDTARLQVEDGGQLAASTFGQGDAGNIVVAARDRATFTGTSPDGVSSGASSAVERGAVGDGGSIRITAPELRVSNGAQLTASSDGTGDAGDIVIRAQERVTFSGTRGQRSSLASSQIEREGEGQGGDIRIETGVLQVRDGAQLAASSAGMGDAGDVLIDARDRVTFAGSGNGRSSRASSQVEADAVGDGGDIAVTTGVLEVRDGAELAASSAGRGDAGNVTITARDRATFAGSGNGQRSAASSQVEAGAMGNGGSIRITTPILRVLDGAELAASSEGAGDAGDVLIDARDRVTFAGADANGRGSSASSQVEAGALGNGGDIRVTAPVLTVRDGGQLAASSLGNGDAGNVEVIARDRINLDGVSAAGPSSGIFTRTGPAAVGRGGNINLRAGNLRIGNGAVVNARTANAGRGGSVDIQAENVNLTRGGQVITTTLGRGQAGDIAVEAETVQISGRDEPFAARQAQFGNDVDNEGAGQSGLFANTREESTGAGGGIRLASERLSIRDGAIISAQSEGRGDGGNIGLEVSDTAQLDDGDITAAAAAGEGGGVRVQAGSLTLNNRSTISAQSGGEGRAGNVVVNTTEALRLRDSDITTAAEDSSGGDIRINTEADSAGSTTLLQGDSDITTDSEGNGGNITVGGAGIIAFDDSDIVSRSNSARGGNITLSTFLSEPTPPGSAPDFDGNAEVDVNASGAIASGTITAPDTSFIQNGLADLPEGLISTDALIANSCVVRNEDGSSTFVVTGVEGLPERPGEAIAPYETGEVQAIPVEPEGWQPGDPMVEPQGLYRLPNGELILSHSCQ